MKAPAPLNLPFGQLFFGFRVTEYKPADVEAADKAAQSPTFSGSGNTLSGRQTGTSKASDPGGKGKAKATAPASAVASTVVKKEPPTAAEVHLKYRTC